MINLGFTIWLKRRYDVVLRSASLLKRPYDVEVCHVGFDHMEAAILDWIETSM